MRFDLFNALFLLVVILSVGLAYLVRIAVKGRAEFERVNRQGGSALLSKQLMEMAYWSLQPVARTLVQLGATPNQLSWASLFLGIGAGAALAFGHFGFAAILSTVSAFLDSLDGMVARLTGSSSDAGEVLDATIDRYAEFFFLGGLAIYYGDLWWMQVVVLAALAGSFMVSYSTAKAEALQIDPPKGSMRRPERAVYLTLGAALSPIAIVWFEADRSAGIALGYPMLAALGLVAVVANVSAVERLYAIAKEIRVREARTRQQQKASLAATSSVDDSTDESSDESHTSDVRPRLP